MLNQRWLIRVGFVAVALGALGWLGFGPAVGQEEGFLKAEKLTINEESRFRQLRDGKVSLDASGSYGKEDRDILDKAAKFYAYRLTEPWYQGKQAPIDTKTMNKLVEEAVQQLQIPDPEKKPRREEVEYMRLFGGYLTSALKRVMKSPEAITRINAARILGYLCKAGNEDAADLLVEALRDPNEIDAVKLYCLRGLKDLFSVKTPAKEREPRLILAMLDYLKQKSAAAQPLPEEEANAVRYLRREAVQALGQVRYPSVEHNGKAEAVAWWLLKVARKDGIQPTPLLPEQIESAIAVCQLQPKLDKSFNLDVAAWNLAWVVVDFCSGSNNRLSLPPTVPWKVAAARLVQAMELLQQNAKGTPEQNAVNTIVERCRKQLDLVILGSPTQPANLEEWLVKNPPKNPTVLRTIAETTLRPPEPGRN
jgi:hypothetical protein